MTSPLTHRRLSRHVLARLVADAPGDVACLTDDHRRSLSARFRAVAQVEHRRLDAWMVERAGARGEGFSWSPATTRRVLGNAALRRALASGSLSPAEAVRDEVTEQLHRVTDGYARGGSLADYLARLRPSGLAVVAAEAANWATQLGEVADDLPAPWRVAPADAYYDVARARTTLRGRRDLVVDDGTRRTLLRVRGGAPGASAGAGLRADLTVDAFADAEGRAANRFVGLWPEAGVVLSVDGTMENLRAGARDLVRAAVVDRRQRLARAA